MENTINLIKTLSTEKLIEATMFFCETTGSLTTQEDELEINEEFLAEPSKHLAEIKEICKVILINAAEQDEFHGLVSDAVNNTGRKNLVITGMDLAILVSGIVAVLRIALNPVSSKKTTYYDENGKKVTIEKKYNNDTSFLTDVFKSLFKPKKD